MKKYIVLLLALVMNVAAWAGDGSYENPYEFTTGENKEFVADKWYKYVPESSFTLLFTTVEGDAWTATVNYKDEEGYDDDGEFSSDEDWNKFVFLRGCTYYLQFDEDVKLDVTLYKVTANMQITDAGVATFCAPFDVTIPAGVKAYIPYLSYEDRRIELTEIEGNVIGACTPVVLYGNACVHNFEGSPVSNDDFASSGDFLGNLCVIDKTLAEYGVDYILQNGTNGVGWYRVLDPGRVIGINRCYLHPSSSFFGAKAFIGMSFDDDTTAIQQIATEAKTMADGKYLVNGKLVVIKSGNAYDIDGKLIK